ncbi:hypothetical protein JHK85_012465 [Glycine max]|nr:hypothetical protein JHK85_012465 [Glycine max]KAG5057138.1 hypothetical protein JHK86_012134 [Glycine max]
MRAIYQSKIGLGLIDAVKRIGAATTLEVRDTATQYVYSPCIPDQSQRVYFDLVNIDSMLT